MESLNIKHTCKNRNTWQTHQQAGVICFIMCLTWATSCLFAQDITITSTVNHNPVGLNQSFLYQVKVSGSTSKLPEPQLPDLTAFKALSGPSTSTNFQMINGAISSSKTYSIELLPKKTGKFTIIPATVKHKGKIYKSNSITITVSKQAARSQRRRSGVSKNNNVSSLVYLEAQATKKSVFLGEPLLVTFKLFFRIPVRGLDYLEQPETIGFWVEEFENQSNNLPQTKEIIEGIEWNVAEIKKIALFPSKTGKLSISPMQLSVQVIERRRSRSSSIFDNSFFDDPFGQRVRKILATEPLTIKVKPLPQNKPANFSGLVGSFQLQSSLDKSIVKSNEAITYKLRISGSGNLKGLKDLNVKFPPDFEVYDPKIIDKVSRSRKQYSTTRTLEYVLIPRVPGEYRLDPVKISYFDPSAKRYKTLAPKSFKVKVNKGRELAGNLNTSIINKSDIALLGKDIHFIKEDELDLIPIGFKPYQTGWFWASIILPVIFLSMAYGYHNYVDKMSTNVEYARKRKASKLAVKRLKGAVHYLKQNKFAEFYGEVSKGLIGFVADKTNMSAAGLLREDVEKQLKEYRIDKKVIKEYLTYLDEADFRRFAPGQITLPEAQDFYKRAERVLEKLGKYL